MPSIRPMRRALMGIPMLIVAITACDTSTAPSASPVTSAPATCGLDEIAASGINGSVVDSDGNPLSDIFLQIDAADGFRGTARTSDDGVFTAPGVTGEFVITTVDIDYASVTRRVTVACGETVDVELLLTLADG